LLLHRGSCLTEKCHLHGRKPISGFVFYSGIPPEQIGTNIPYHLERMFTLAGNIDHMELRSLPGIGLIKVYFCVGSSVTFVSASAQTP
jgi:hypothetical protein